MNFPVEKLRNNFPSLSRLENGQPVVYLDGPAGTQVPQSVADAMAQSILHHNANTHGHFITSSESESTQQEALAAAADFVGSNEPAEIIFGQNMTTLTFQISRSLARSWNRGTNIVVTRLDHDANFTPWKMAAEDAGVEVKIVDVQTSDATLDLNQIESVIDSNTRLVAMTCASNAVGSKTPIRVVADIAHANGALLFLDAVHYAPHDLIDVTAWNCDFLACSTYKFFGPHIGLIWGRKELLRSLTPYKVRPASEDLPDRWMTGTPNFACLAGATAAINYIADIAPGAATNRRQKLANSFESIVEYESELARRMLSGLSEIEGGQIHGIGCPSRINERVPTIAFTKDNKTADELSQILGENYIFSWAGNYYAIELTESLGLEPDGMLRLGLMHYNTLEEVDKTVEILSKA